VTAATRNGSLSEVPIGVRSEIIRGEPDPKHIPTPFVERQNLTMRMSMRRFTRLTNAFSKKLENHAAAVALHYMHYNFGRIHKTLRVTPAMQAGLSDHVWSLSEIVGWSTPKRRERPRRGHHDPERDAREILDEIPTTRKVVKSAFQK